VTKQRLANLADELREFLFRPLSAAASGKVFNRSWTDGGPWLIPEG
jgi:hypothetical protein